MEVLGIFVGLVVLLGIGFVLMPPKDPEDEDLM